MLTEKQGDINVNQIVLFFTSVTKVQKWNPSLQYAGVKFRLTLTFIDSIKRVSFHQDFPDHDFLVTARVVLSMEVFLV